VTLRRLRRNGIAAWLGLLALAVQAFLPVHLAAAMSASATGGPEAHVLHHQPHALLAHHLPHRSPLDHSHAGHIACPLCTALHGAGVGAATLPGTVAAQLPNADAGFIVLRAADLDRPASRPAAYLSRAPPSIG
jgi:Protein of unknown function (DUF2946)